jgi:hypothetical protein
MISRWIKIPRSSLNSIALITPGIINHSESGCIMGNMGYFHQLFTTVFFSFSFANRKNDPYGP